MPQSIMRVEPAIFDSSQFLDTMINTLLLHYCKGKESRMLKSVIQGKSILKLKQRPLLVIGMLLLAVCFISNSACKDFDKESISDTNNTSKVFDNAYERAVKEKQEHEEQYKAILEQLNAFSEDSDEFRSLDEQAGEIEMVMDMDFQRCHLLEKIIGTKVSIGQSDGVMELSQIAVVDQSFFFAIAAPPDCALDEEPIVYVNGIQYKGINYSEFLVSDMAGESHSIIYKCELNRSLSSLPETILIVIQNGDSTFCFRYAWNEQKVEQPKNDAIREQWLSENNKEK